MCFNTQPKLKTVPLIYTGMRLLGALPGLLQNFLTGPCFYFYHSPTSFRLPFQTSQYILDTVASVILSKITHALYSSNWYPRMPPHSIQSTEAYKVLHNQTLSHFSELIYFDPSGLLYSSHTAVPGGPEHASMSLLTCAALNPLFQLFRLPEILFKR